ncbi:MAG: hypothetical protein ACK5JR_10990 [Tropicimonas sp.]|uniref:hypothetical protein n=1 Tax=Tropicimonas sp. TaxID=2067044 RepID=UPI003A8B5372
MFEQDPRAWRITIRLKTPWPRSGLWGGDSSGGSFASDSPLSAVELTSATMMVINPDAENSYPIDMARAVGMLKVMADCEAENGG